MLFFVHSTRVFILFCQQSTTKFHSNFMHILCALQPDFLLQYSLTFPGLDILFQCSLTYKSQSVVVSIFNGANISNQTNSIHIPGGQEVVGSNPAIPILLILIPSSLVPQGFKISYRCFDAHSEPHYFIKTLLIFLNPISIKSTFTLPRF